MRRMLALLLLLLLSSSFAGAEDVLTLRTATSVEEAEQFLLLPPEDGVAGVQAGYIRYISQVNGRDPSFRTAYWLGGEEGSMLDLTVKSRYGYEYGFHAGNMCTRAVYSMALSCIGVDMTPGAMSALTGERNLDEPYDMISEAIGVERVERRSKIFNTMMENYLTDERYSPVYLYIRKPSGNYHALLVVATIPEKGRYIVVDSNPYYLHGEPVRVYFISLNKNRTEIINSTFRDELVGSEVLQVHQWRLTDDAITD